MHIKHIIEQKIPHNERVEVACLRIHACLWKASVSQSFSLLLCHECIPLWDSTQRCYTTFLSSQLLDLCILFSVKTATGYVPILLTSLFQAEKKSLTHSTWEISSCCWSQTCYSCCPQHDLFEQWQWEGDKAKKKLKWCLRIVLQPRTRLYIWLVSLQYKSAVLTPNWN